jgi:type II secretory pathway component PulM
MKNSHWIAVVVGAFIVGILFGYGIWGPRAARLAQVEQDLSAAEGQVSELKKQVAETRANLGQITDEKLTLEKQMAETKEAAEKEKAAKTKKR